MAGRVLLGASFAVLGGLLLGAPGFAAAWPPLPKSMPAHDVLVMASGVLLLMGGLALLVSRTATAAAVILAGFLLVHLLVLHVPQVAAHPRIEVVWQSMGETLAELGGIWIVFLLSSPAGAPPTNSDLDERPGGARARIDPLRAGQILFGLALLPFGLSHFFYLELTAPLIPVWLPFHVPLAYATGAAHFAAGLAILLNVLPRLAATLEAVMVSLFTLIIWIPALIAAPSNLSDWSEMCVSTAIVGAAWAVAESFRSRSWLASGPVPRLQFTLGED